MAKAGKKSNARPWTEAVEPTEIREALTNATVDAHDEYEQHTSLLTAIQDELAFPFRVEVLGATVQVVDVEWPQTDEFGLDLVVERQGQRHRIDARSANLLPPFPEGHLYLAAYLDWKSRL